MKLRRLLSSACLVPIALSGLSGCTSAPVAGPPPSDPVVYDASSETRSTTGIAKWGYATDSAGTTIFHGYGADNEQIVEVRHTFQITDPFTRRFALKMSGPDIAGSVQIEYESVWIDETQGAQYVAHMRENTILRGTLASRILDRVASDATTIPDNAAAATLTDTTVKTSARPLDLPEGAPKLVDDNGQLVTCCCQLINNGASLAGSTASECGQVGAGTAPGVQTAGLIQPLDVRGLPPPQDLIVGADGTPQVDSPWVPPYNIVDNHCHNAAAANVSKTNGYVACQSISSTTAWGGHTVNWAPDPTKAPVPPIANAQHPYCIYEPQSNGLTLVDGAACCWEGPMADDGAPDLTTPAAAECAKKMCAAQYNPPGEGGTDAMPVGQTPLVQRNCPATTSSRDTCNACCTSVADDVAAHFSDAGTDIADYRKRCATACSDRYLVSGSPGLAPKSFGALSPATLNGPVDVAATRCLASGMASNSALAEARALCGIQ